MYVIGLVLVSEARVRMKASSLIAQNESKTDFIRRVLQSPVNQDAEFGTMFIDSKEVVAMEFEREEV